MTPTGDTSANEASDGSRRKNRDKTRRGGALAQHGSKACDECRRRKRRCAGAEPNSKRCANCDATDSVCSWITPTKKRGPKAYVESLEERLEEMETLFKKLNVEVDSTGTVRASSSNIPVPSPGITVKREPDLEDSPHPSDDEMHPSGSTKHVDWIQKVQSEPTHPRFYGKSSGLMLIKMAEEFVHERDRIRPPSDGSDGKKYGYRFARRPEFWTPQPWEIATTLEIPGLVHKYSLVDGKRLQFPDDDLLPILVDLFFTEMNVYFPILHRTSFQNAFLDGLHLRHLGFAHVLLLVCATGSRFSDDSRVFVDGISGHSAGWIWYVQAQLEPSVTPECNDLYEMQRCCLCALYVQGTSAPYACWAIIGVGIRLAMDLGIHRRKLYGSQRTVERELWKRAFWSLVNFDRMASCNLGRPCAVQDEDFDLELPTCCDDEFWAPDDSRPAFRQPLGKPSTMAYFICLTELNRILAFAMRTLYSINQLKPGLGFVGEQWRQRIVDQLDTALQDWLDSLPEHLRWDPLRAHHIFFHQSAILHSMYYHVKIIVHRPFIASPRNPLPSTVDSLDICVEAARACSVVLDTHVRRTPSLPSQSGLIAFACGIILLLPQWRHQWDGSSSTSELIDVAVDVNRCLDVLQAFESRWHSSGRLRDILTELASLADILSSSASSPTNSDTASEGAASPCEIDFLESRKNIPGRAPNNSVCTGSSSAPKGSGGTSFSNAFSWIIKSDYSMDHKMGEAFQPEWPTQLGNLDDEQKLSLLASSYSGLLEPDDWDLTPYLVGSRIQSA